MNAKLGRIGSLVTAVCVALFAVCMLISFTFGSFFVCIFLSLGFVVMTGAFAQECEPERRAAANAAMIFAGVYCALILLVYFAQTTSVRLDGLNPQALQILDYSRSGLFFNYDLLGYGLMALSTFFLGLTLRAESRADRWLKALLLIHGVFFVSCLILPMLGLFSAGTEGGARGGVIALEGWCAYFLPLCLLSWRHFRGQTGAAGAARR